MVLDSVKGILLWHRAGGRYLNLEVCVWGEGGGSLKLKTNYWNRFRSYVFLQISGVGGIAPPPLPTALWHSASSINLNAISHVSHACPALLEYRNLIWFLLLHTTVCTAKKFSDFTRYSLKFRLSLIFDSLLKNCHFAYFRFKAGQGRNHGKMLAAISVMVGRICPLHWSG